MLLVGAINNIVILQRVITAFWGGTGQTPAEFLNETDVTSNYIESTSWFLQVVIGDAFMVRDLILHLTAAFIPGVVDVSVLDLVWEEMAGVISTSRNGISDFL